MRIDTLQIYYDSFINQDNKRSFLRGMADYMELILSDKKCKSLILDIQNIKKDFIDKNSKLDEIANKKVRVFKEDYREILEEAPDLSFDNTVAGTPYTRHRFSDIIQDI